MDGTALNKVVEDFKSLNSEEKEYALELLQNQVNEDFRKKFLKKAKVIDKKYSEGKLKHGSAQDLLNDLES
ncbi:MAG: hypothetical protein JST55_08550 [Bacteroidetes bacterium]|nr:hypothetical protein [Bacteroidota bacterium]